MKLAIFDFDGTLIEIDSLPFLLKMWGKLGYPKSRMIFMYLRIGGLYIRYKLGLTGRMTNEQLKKTAFQKFTIIFRGMTKQQIKEFFNKSANGLYPKLNKQVVDEAKKAKDRGYYTVLLSGFYQDLMDLVAEQVGIDKALGTSMHFSEGVIQEKMPMRIRTGSDKVVRIKEEFPHADFDASYSYADSFSDLELLELVGTPVAVLPDDELRGIALDRNWRIMD